MISDLATSSLHKTSNHPCRYKGSVNRSKATIITLTLGTVLPGDAYTVSLSPGAHPTPARHHPLSVRGPLGAISPNLISPPISATLTIFYCVKSFFNVSLCRAADCRRATYVYVAACHQERDKARWVSSYHHGGGQRSRLVAPLAYSTSKYHL